MSWQLKAFSELTAIELYEILKERTNVFVVEQNCPYLETDGKDFVSLHLYRKMDGVIVAYARLLPPGVSFEEASIGRVLMHADYRRQGLAAELLAKALDVIVREKKEKAVKIQAQEYLKGFYESFGFRTVTGCYMEDGIPHINMVLQVK
ncbi:GNAT family N-acetyltransferase [Metabacillus sp. 84]|uniref:GNAT family N-acetyltransferase n=1 Tax=Metabacillus sp. 84 TaxID=3404705 RepID=UPI003CE9B8A2